MARFAGKKEKEVPALNMGSMSDIIFMLLFFFMVITTMRESTLFVKINPPQGTEVSKLEKKMFTAPCPKADTALQELAQELYGEYAEKVKSKM